jgi:hypothetical protein
MNGYIGDMPEHVEPMGHAGMTLERFQEYVKDLSNRPLPRLPESVDKSYGTSDEIEGDGMLMFI